MDSLKVGLIVFWIILYLGIVIYAVLDMLRGCKSEERKVTNEKVK